MEIRTTLVGTHSSMIDLFNNFNVRYYCELSGMQSQAYKKASKDNVSMNYNVIIRVPDSFKRPNTNCINKWITYLEKYT